MCHLMCDARELDQTLQATIDSYFSRICVPSIRVGIKNIARRLPEHSRDSFVDLLFPTDLKKQTKESSLPFINGSGVIF